MSPLTQAWNTNNKKWLEVAGGEGGEAKIERVFIR
jgi:hypothetical protein